jgi:hypothetical protein
LFQKISRWDSWDAKVVAAALTERRSLRSSWRNFSLPLEGEGGVVGVMVSIATSALDYILRF